MHIARMLQKYYWHFMLKVIYFKVVEQDTMFCTSPFNCNLLKLRSQQVLFHNVLFIYFRIESISILVIEVPVMLCLVQ